MPYYKITDRRDVMKGRMEYKVNIELKNEVLEFIKKYKLINPKEKIVLGVSGGPDSIFMLDILNKIKNNKDLDFEIVVAHINHMIREEAKEDEQYVINFCKKNNIVCYTKRIDVKKIAYNKKIGTEEAGRIVRYKFFDEVLSNTNSNKIAIAHNKNDKVETIIMNLLRGSGVSGLKGIEPIRDNKYIRPILEIERSRIEQYCDYNKLDPKIDKTNFENTYTRNKVRNVIIPYIKEEFNPNIIDTIDRLSEVAEEEDKFLNKITKEEFKNVLILKNNNKIVLDLNKFNTLDDVIMKRLILCAITELLGSSKGIEKIHLEDIIRLCTNNIGNKFLTPNKSIKISIENKKINFEKL